MAPHSDLKSAMGDIERKVDMSLDDIIKQSRDKGKKQHRPKIKQENRISVASRLQPPQVKQLPQVQQTREVHNKRREMNQGSGLHQRRDVLQRFVALRSSALRQGKLAESRAKNNDNFQFIATKAAARQALSRSAGPPVTRFSRQPLQRTSGSVGLGAQRQKILGFNQSSKTGATRRPAGWQQGSVGKGVTVQPQRQRQTWGLNNISTSGTSRKPQTLDSRFASLREERQLKLQLGPYAGRRR